MRNFYALLSHSAKRVLSTPTNILCFHSEKVVIISPVFAYFCIEGSLFPFPPQGSFFLYLIFLFHAIIAPVF